MRSLVVAPTLPSESGNGLAMRIGVFIEALSRLGEVELIVLPIFGSDGSTNALCRRLDVDPIIVPTEGRADTQFKLLGQIADPNSRLASFRQYGKPSLSAFVSVPVLAEIRQRVAGQNFDFVHIARAYLLPVVDAWPKGERPLISVDLDEDDVRAHQSIAMLHRLRGDAEAGARHEAEAAAFARLIEERLHDADLAFVSTDLDRETLRGRSPGCDPVLAENAVAIPDAPARERPGLELLFVGGFGYLPNLDAASWILDTIFPLLTASFAGTVSLTIVGRNPPLALTSRAASLGATLLGDVEDLAPIYARSTLALVPMRAGGGSRIKLLEAAAHGVPIVATTIGAEGTRMRDGEELWLADTPQAIVDAIATVLRSPDEAARRAGNARASVERFHLRQASISTLSRHFDREVGARQRRCVT
jgi:glycosyltransferase involved in cell wall biosynthesis